MASFLKLALGPCPRERGRNSRVTFWGLGIQLDAVLLPQDRGSNQTV
jgi:hypothetical protein